MVVECYIRVLQFFIFLLAGHKQHLGGLAWALPGPPLATPLVARASYSYVSVCIADHSHKRSNLESN